MKRLFIYMKDAQIITGKSDKSCRLMFKKIKTHYQKGPKDSITFREFFEFNKIDYDRGMNDLQ